MQNGIELEVKQDKLLRYRASRCYIVLALTFSKYQQIQNQNGIQEALCMTVDTEQCYNEAWKLCDGHDPYVMQYYGLFLKETATNAEDLTKAAETLEQLHLICPHKHVVAHQLALTYEALWITTEKQRHNTLSTKARQRSENQREPRSSRYCQGLRYQGAGERDNFKCDTKHKQVNKKSIETLEAKGSNQLNMETVESTVGSNNKISKGTLEGAKGGSNQLSKETLEGVVGSSNQLSKETLESAVGSSSQLSRETLEGGGRISSIRSSSETLEGAIQNIDINVWDICNNWLVCMSTVELWLKFSAEIFTQGGFRAKKNFITSSSTCTTVFVNGQ